MAIDTTVADILSLDLVDGGLTLTPLFDPMRAAYRAGWLGRDESHVFGYGDTADEAFTNLFLTLSGKGAEIEKAILLREALAAEARLQVEYTEAVATRERLEKQPIAVVDDIPVVITRR